MKKLVMIGISLCLITILGAQIGFPKPDFNPFRVNNPDIFNPNKLKISHSMGFEAGSSSTGSGYYLSRYTSHLNYKLSPAWDMQLNLNFVNFGSTSTAKSIEFNDDNSSKVFPDFNLRYKPNDNFQINIHVEQGFPTQQYRNYWNSRW